MKKIVCMLTIFVLLMVLSIVAVAKEPIKVIVDGQKIEFDIPPQIINSRTMVPFRAIFEALGAKVDWYEETLTVVATKEDINIQFVVDDYTMYVNEKAIPLDISVIIVNGRILVPVRAVSEAFGIDVSWDGKTNTVFISKKSDDGSKDVIDVTDEILPEIQGYWYFGSFEGEVGDFFIRIDGKEYMDGYYDSYVCKDGEILSITKNEYGIMVMNLRCEIPVWDDSGGVVETYESYIITSIDNFADNLILIAEDGWTSGYKYMGKTEEEFRSNMSAL